MLALVIDSFAQSRCELKENLRSLGFDTLEAARGRTAVLTLQSATLPDVVFCARIAGEEDVELINTLQGIHAERDLPLVVTGVCDAKTGPASPRKLPSQAELLDVTDRDALTAALAAAGVPLPQPVESQTVSSPRSTTSSNPDTEARSVRVLVVDPSSMVRQLLSKVLRDSAGFDIAATAQDGAAALEKIERLAPDVVTLDLVMPVLDGFKAIELIRDRWPDLPIIVFSALIQSDDHVKRKCLLLGANDCLSKPGTMPDVATAEHWLQQNLIPRLGQFFPAGSPLERPKPTSPRPVPKPRSDDTIRIVSDTQVVRPKKKRHRKP